MLITLFPWPFSFPSFCTIFAEDHLDDPEGMLQPWFVFFFMIL